MAILKPVAGVIGPILRDTRPLHKNRIASCTTATARAVGAAQETADPITSG